MIKDLRVALKDFEPMVKELHWLHTGGDIENFSLRPREAWTNWLLCAVWQHLYGDRITFAEDKNSDGLILDRETGNCIVTEHVCALNIPEAKPRPTGEERIIEAINSKIAKGPQYAKGVTLVVFFDGAGTWHRNKVREAINGKHNFDGIYLVGLAEQNRKYTVTELHENDSISFLVEINDDFTDWKVAQIQ